MRHDRKPQIIPIPTENKILRVFRSNEQWWAVTYSPGRASLERIEGQCATDADAWLAARKQFAGEGKR